MASSSKCRTKHGAIVTKGGRVLSTSVNTLRNDPELFEPSDGAPHAVLGMSDNPREHSTLFTYHAETRAIKPLSEDALRGATIYVARVIRSGVPGLSRPCNPCYMELTNKGIKKIVFTVG